MDESILIAFSLLACLGGVVALLDWRAAFLFVIVIGFAQDPVRKLLPGEPVVMVMMSTALLGLALIGAMRRHGLISFKPISAGNPKTGTAAMFFVALVLLHAIQTIVNYQTPVVAGVGVLSYLAPIPAIWIAYYYARDVGDIKRFLLVYVWCAVVAAVGILLSKSGVESLLFKEIGEGTVLYDPDLGLIEQHSGIMRSPEVAAWHAGAAACILVSVAAGMRSPIMKFVSPLLVFLFLIAGVLTGRRKMLAVVATFAVVYFVLLYYYRQRSGSRALMAVLVSAVAVAIGVASMTDDTSSFTPYLARGQTLAANVTDRFLNLGIASVGWALEAAGPWGKGTGVVSQGAQHFVTFDDQLAGAGEGGLGKIVVELGLPGLALALALLVMLTRNLVRVLDLAARHDPALLRLSLGLTALLAANIPVFVGASQIYGDPFVLSMLGISAGFIFAIPRVLRTGIESKAALVAQRVGPAMVAFDRNVGPQ